MRTSENSSDLERAPGARSIAIEFLEVRMAVQKLQRCANRSFHFHVAPFGIQSPLITKVFHLFVIGSTTLPRVDHFSEHQSGMTQNKSAIREVACSPKVLASKMNVV